MYKCKKCGESSEAGQSRLTVVTYRPGINTQIESETPVCMRCKFAIEGVAPPEVSDGALGQAVDLALEQESTL